MGAEGKGVYATGSTERKKKGWLFSIAHRLQDKLISIFLLQYFTFLLKHLRK